MRHRAPLPSRLDLPAAKTPGRLLFVDNIRWTMVILVLTMHAMDTHSPFGNWYYTNRTDSSFGTILFFGIYQSFLQAFFMALLFFVSGYFTLQAGFAGDFNFISAIKCTWEAFVCLGMSVGLLAFYRRTMDHQSAWAKYLSDNAFAVYLFHPPVLIAIALTLHDLSAPALVKDLLLSLSA